jgi:hypothetical protein
LFDEVALKLQFGLLLFAQLFGEAQVQGLQVRFLVVEEQGRPVQVGLE